MVVFLVFFVLVSLVVRRTLTGSYERFSILLIRPKIPSTKRLYLLIKISGTGAVFSFNAPIITNIDFSQDIRLANAIAINQNVQIYSMSNESRFQRHNELRDEDLFLKRTMS